MLKLKLFAIQNYLLTNNPSSDRANYRLILKINIVYDNPIVLSLFFFYLRQRTNR